MRTMITVGAVLVLGLVSSLVQAEQGTKVEKNGLTCERIVPLIDDKEVSGTDVKMNDVLKIDFRNVKGLTLKDGRIYPGVAIAMMSPAGEKLLSSENVLAVYAQKGLPSFFASTITATVQIGAPMKQGQTYRLDVRLFDLKGKGEIEYQTELVVAGENKIDSAEEGTIKPDGLTIDRVALAFNDKERVVAAFTPGETVQFFPLNVRGLQKDTQGMHAFDMDVTVTDAAGKVLFARKGLLGDKGHLALEDGVLKYPVVKIDTADYAPGKYTATVMVYDKNSSRRAEASRSFALIDIGRK